MFTWPPNPLLGMASSFLPLYSAALGVIEFSFLLGATFSATVSAGLESSGLGSEPASAAAVGSLGCVAGSVPAGLVAELSEGVSDAVGVTEGKLLPFFCAS